MKNFKNKFNLVVEKEMMDLLKYRKSPSSSNSTHVSMVAIKGKYSFNRDDIEQIYKNAHKHTSMGLAEKPPTYSMFRTDFDLQEEATTPKPLYDMNIF